MTKTVLITTAISPPAGVPFLQMTDAATRHITTKGAVFFWAAQGIDNMVIADATGTTLLRKDEVELLRQMGVTVEQIHFQQDTSLIQARGKGYGEGLLLEFAMRNSTLLKKEPQFFKCTGKIFCRNLEVIQQTIANNKVTQLFWRHQEAGTPEKPWADMRFFYTTKTFCLEHLVPAYLKTQDQKLEVAEQFCFDVLNQTLAIAKTIRPLLTGFAGWTGKLYSEANHSEQDENYACWVNP